MPKVTLLNREQFMRALECAELNAIADRATLLALLQDPDERETLTYYSDQFYKAPEALVCVADLQSKEELHYVAAHLNWDDGLKGPRAILAHPLCDAGTARLLYWYGQGWFHSNPETADPLQAAFYEALVQRFVQGDFATCSIAFDPFEDGFVPEVAHMIKERLQFPGILLATYPAQVFKTRDETYDAYFEDWKAEHQQL